ncbi:hypothetical protein U9M48_011707 [Paspalum notatum var. saurae]|uniref:Uncharacterized protein n=1 Tax=Paspalum notatum var. saurae TaxID=547442 RepID=A0AAQ3SY04_PASNO
MCPVSSGAAPLRPSTSDGRDTPRHAPPPAPSPLAPVGRLARFCYDPAGHLGLSRRPALPGSALLRSGGYLACPRPTRLRSGGLPRAVCSGGPLASLASAPHLNVTGRGLGGAMRWSGPQPGPVTPGPEAAARGWRRAWMRWPGMATDWCGGGSWGWRQRARRRRPVMATMGAEAAVGDGMRD